VAVFKEAREAPGASDRSPFDLLMCDMIMEEDFDGLDAFREISQIYPHQKCIIVSGFAESERSRAAINLGAGQFISKPYTLQKLASAVRKELDA